MKTKTIRRGHAAMTGIVATPPPMALACPEAVSSPTRTSRKAASKRYREPPEVLLRHQEHPIQP